MLLVFLPERNNSHLNAAVHENNMDEEKQTTEITTQEVQCSHTPLAVVLYLETIGEASFQIAKLQGIYRFS